MSSATTDLCPFCGSHSNAVEGAPGPINQTLFYVKCLGCEAHGPLSISHFAACYTWGCKGHVPMKHGLWLDEAPGYKPTHSSFDVSSIREILNKGKINPDSTKDDNK